MPRVRPDRRQAEAQRLIGELDIAIHGRIAPEFTDGNGKIRCQALLIAPRKTIGIQVDDWIPLVLALKVVERAPDLECEPDDELLAQIAGTQPLR